MRERKGSDSEHQPDSRAGGMAPLSSQRLLRAHLGAAREAVSLVSRAGAVLGRQWAQPALLICNLFRSHLPFPRSRPLLNILFFLVSPSPWTHEALGAGFCLLHSCKAPGTYEQFQFTGNTQQTPPEERRFHCSGATRHRRTHRAKRH